MPGVAPGGLAQIEAQKKVVRGNKGVRKGLCDPKSEFPSSRVVQPENLLLASIKNTHFLTDFKPYGRDSSEANHPVL